MTDREIAVATFKAVAELYRALTGKSFSLLVETQAGTFRIVEGEAPIPSADLAERC